MNYLQAFNVDIYLSIPDNEQWVAKEAVIVDRLA